MRTIAFALSIIALIAVVHGAKRVENLRFVAPASFNAKTMTGPDSNVGPKSVEMIFSNGDIREYPSDKDQHKDYDPDCEDVPANEEEEEEGTYCPPAATLGYKKLVKGGENDFGTPVNDVGDELSGEDYDIKAAKVTGGIPIPIISNTKGQKHRLFHLIAIDGGSNKVSSVQAVEQRVDLNFSKKIISVSDVSSKDVHGLLSPSQPRITASCSAMFTEKKAPRARDGFLQYQALEHYIHPLPPTESGDIWDNLLAYHYGWPTEARVEGFEEEFGIHKRYAFGRGNWAGVHCLPDGHTCLFWGDGHLLAFVATEKYDMTMGRLFYVAKASEGKLSWMEVGRKPDEVPYAKLGDKADEDEGESPDDPVGPIPKGQGKSEVHEGEVKDFIDAIEDNAEAFEAVFHENCSHPDAVMVDHDANDWTPRLCLVLVADPRIAARVETILYLRYVGAATNFSGPSLSISDVTYSREWTDEDGNRGALFFSVEEMYSNKTADKFGAYAKCGGVFQASLTSWKDVVEAEEDEDTDYVLEKPTKWLPKQLILIVGKETRDEEKCDALLQYPTSVAWAHFHNMLFVGTTSMGTKNSLIIGYDLSEAASDEDKVQVVFSGEHNSTVTGLTFNPSMVGTGDAWLTFAVADRDGEREGEYGMIGPLRMRGYGTTDQLQNLGCPRFSSDHPFHKKYPFTEYPFPEEEE